MNAFNRGFIALLALAWVAVLGAAIWLVWDQARLVEIDSSAIKLNFDLIANRQAEQILATIIAAALMLPALMLLALEMKPSRRRDMVLATANEGDVRNMQSRIDTLEKDLTEERARNENLRHRDNDRVEANRVTNGGSRRWHLFPRH
ncbi:MAG: hypothetical protein AB7T32_20430 [Dehalococcoidia bacterium]